MQEGMRYLRVRFFWGESKNGFVISDNTDFSLPKKRSKKGSFTMTTA